MIDNVTNKIRAIEIAIQELNKTRSPLGEWPSVKYLRMAKEDYEKYLENLK